MKALSKREVNKFVKKHPEWKVNAKYSQLSRSVSFSSYIDGLIFIARTTVHAEILSHHPEITFTANKLVYKLSTKELKSVSKLDTDLAKRIDKILNN